MKKTVFYILSICANITWAQVGINTETPQATLDVVGDAIADGSLFLEAPNASTQILGSNLLIRSTTNDKLKYDIGISKYGPINYAQFAFRSASTNGLLDYDTKISIADYTVTIQGFYFLKTDGNTSLTIHSNTSNDDSEYYQFYAYKNSTTQTWFIKAFVNNATFRSGPSNIPVDILLNLIIYRKRFISKELPAISIDMGDMETGTAPIPLGF